MKIELVRPINHMSTFENRNSQNDERGQKRKSKRIDKDECLRDGFVEGRNKEKEKKRINK